MSKLSHGAQLMFVKLIVSVDDYGRFDGRPEILKGQLYPLEKGTDEAMIVGWLDELSAGAEPPIATYWVGGRPFLSLTGWEKHRGSSRRAAKSKFPDPAEGESIASSEIREIPGDPPVSRESGVVWRVAGDDKSVALAPCPKSDSGQKINPLSNAKVAKMIAVKPNGVEHTPAEVQAWFQVKARVMILKGYKSLSRTAGNWWPNVKPGEVRAAVAQLQDEQDYSRAKVLRAEIESRPDPALDFTPEQIEAASRALG